MHKGKKITFSLPFYAVVRGAVAAILSLGLDWAAETSLKLSTYELCSIWGLIKCLYGLSDCNCEFCYL